MREPRSGSEKESSTVRTDQLGACIRLRRRSQKNKKKQPSKSFAGVQRRGDEVRVQRTGRLSLIRHNNLFIPRKRKRKETLFNGEKP